LVGIIVFFISGIIGISFGCGMESMGSLGYMGGDEGVSWDGEDGVWLLVVLIGVLVG